MLRRLAVVGGAVSSVGFLIPFAGAMPWSHTVRTAESSSKQIAIPFKRGHASIVAITATVTKTTNGPTSGVPIKLSIGNLAKLSSKLRIAAIGGQTGQSITPAPNGPPTTKLTYTILVAIDATNVRSTASAARPSAAEAGDALEMIMNYASGSWDKLNEQIDPCADAKSKLGTFANVPIAKIRSSVQLFKVDTGVACK